MMSSYGFSAARPASPKNDVHYKWDYCETYRKAL